MLNQCTINCTIRCLCRNYRPDVHGKDWPVVGIVGTAGVVVVGTLADTLVEPHSFVGIVVPAVAD